MNWTEQIIKLTEIKIRYIFAVAIFGGLLIFLPVDVAQQMSIIIPESIRPWVGFSTLAASVLWSVLMFAQFFAWMHKKLAERRTKKEILCQLETLSRSERDLFLFCLSENQQTINRNISDPAVSSLCAKRLLVMAFQGNSLCMPFVIPGFVWKYVKTKQKDFFPELFDENSMKKLEERQNNNWMR